MIKPTIGRVLWYWPARGELVAKVVDQPHAALVCRIHNERCVNLAVHDANGEIYQRQSVLLVQEGDIRPEGGFAEWMPYQIGQAKAAEAPVPASPVEAKPVPQFASVDKATD